MESQNSTKGNRFTFCLFCTMNRQSPPQRLYPGTVRRQKKFFKNILATSGKNAYNKESLFSVRSISPLRKTDSGAAMTFSTFRRIGLHVIQFE